MSISPISLAVDKSVKIQEINPWKETCKLIWKIFISSITLINSMLLVSDYSKFVLTGTPIIYVASLFSLTVLIYVSFSFGLKYLQDAGNISKDLYSFWKGHEVEKA
ncbi:MAG: hypothetical protein WCT85_02020 [Parachlamydiales bacterium]|jgi:hypothetical protein